MVRFETVPFVESFVYFVLIFLVVRAFSRCRFHVSRFHEYTLVLLYLLKR